MLVWVEGGLNPNEIKKRVLGTDPSDIDFGKRLLAFLDDTISNFIPDDPDPNVEVYHILVDKLRVLDRGDGEPFVAAIPTVPTVGDQLTWTGAELTLQFDACSTILNGLNDARGVSDLKDGGKATAAELARFGNITVVQAQSNLFSNKLAFDQNCSVSDLD
ncbi:hypothetical protein B0H13DRAFT_2327137 [Mycena leptocephala]|nr:hypothetical protein B0H13DRAFT_2327137 [Mycena leptocephala]